MDFVFMLTRNDATVENALDLVETASLLGLKHIGFKDVGADPSQLKRLTEAIRAAGAAAWMEVVSTSRDDELRSIALARALGVDWLMGGVHVEEALRILAGSATRYLPFAGKPVGHPTQLGGSAREVEAHCRAFAQKGCAGVDILAYRATEAEPLDLVAACRRGLSREGDGRCRRIGQFVRPHRRHSRRRRRRLHHRHGGDRGVLCARGRAARGPAHGCPRRLPNSGMNPPSARCMQRLRSIT